ncbi:hypothetical protein SKAU_G00105740 [Synaphobranchus kaupii]|uniref:Uncharacterized protein n=1 Tax=Synaphobranchus kaupii TaxID=118154 RepID=A0A9Q1J7V5_SYNKA|nr:hypothetical protein SKAU_G00105740 [Synaphobranchus kaupii]
MAIQLGVARGHLLKMCSLPHSLLKPQDSWIPVHEPEPWLHAMRLAPLTRPPKWADKFRATKVFKFMPVRDESALEQNRVSEARALPVLSCGHSGLGASASITPCSEPACASLHLTVGSEVM